MATAFSGEIEVEGDEFELYARQFIVHDDRIRVHLESKDSNDTLGAVVDADIPLTATHNYASLKVPIKYKGQIGYHSVSLALNIVQIDEDLCIVKGSWTEGSRYEISAKLVPFGQVEQFKNYLRTGWFNTSDSPPAREGVYECDEGMFTYWDGKHFLAPRRSPNAALKQKDISNESYLVNFWRGILKLQ